MNTRKFFYGILTILVLAGSACTTTSTAEEDDIYVEGIDRRKIKLPKGESNSIAKSKIKIHKSDN